MWGQLAIRLGLTMGSITLSGFGFWLPETVYVRRKGWPRRPPHTPKLFAVVVGAGAVVLAMLMAAAALRAVAFAALGLFSGFQAAFHFALLPYATVGYGNEMPPGDWRILGAMAAGDGFIAIGMLTTLLTEGLGYVREGYEDSNGG